MVNEYVQSDDGRADIEEQGFAERTRKELEDIGLQFYRDINSAYASVLTRSRAGTGGSDALLGPSSWRMLPEIKVTISKKNGTATITLRYPADLLFRPSLEKFEWGYNNWMEERRVGGRWKREIMSKRIRKGTGQFTGPGIKDIFALVTHGYDRIRHPVSGLWHDGPDGDNKITYALPQRTGTPFVPSIVAKYEALYPNVTILYPAEWG
jgi:hypothetical protein